MSALPQPPGSMQQVYKYPSMTSVNTMASIGYLPPGHGYVPKKEKPEKPYGLTFTTVMNRTHRGPGRKHLRYALSFAIAAILFFSGAALYLGHRDVSRMIVYRTEVLGALMVVAGVLCIYMMGKCMWMARAESNKWRYGIRFRPEGLTTAAAYNEAYVPEDVHGEKLSSGTYGPKALKEIPKPRRGKPKSRARSKDNLEQVGLPARPMHTVDEADEGRPFTVEGAPPPGPHPPRAPPGGFPRGPAPPGGYPRGPPPAGYRPRGPPPPGWRGPHPGGFGPRGPPPPGWRPPPPRWRGPRPVGGGIPLQPQRVPPSGPGPHQLQPRPYLNIGGVVSKDSESEL